MSGLDDHNARMQMLEKDTVLRAFVDDDICRAPAGALQIS